MRNKILAVIIAATTASFMLAFSLEKTFAWSPPLETPDYAGAQTLFAQPATLQVWDYFGADAWFKQISDGRRFAFIDVVVNEGQQAVELIAKDEFNNETSTIVEVEGYSTLGLAGPRVVIPAGQKAGAVFITEDSPVWDQLNLNRLSGLSLKIQSNQGEGFSEADIQTVRYCVAGLDCQTITGDAGAIYLSSIPKDTNEYPQYESSIP